MEQTAYSHYSRKHFPISYWRTTSDYEVDFILEDAQAAHEVKASSQVVSHHTKGLTAFGEEYQSGKKIIVSLDSSPHVIRNIHILPWKFFWKNCGLEKLYSFLFHRNFYKTKY